MKHFGNSSLYKALSLLLIIALILSSIPVKTAYRRTYSLKASGKTYILDLRIILENIGDYGVISIYLRPEGTYAYGFTLLKDPDEKYPHLYLMLGLQDKWFDLGLWNKTYIRLRLVIDTNSSKALLVLFEQGSREYNLTYVPKLKQLYLSVFNITGRNADYPSIYISKLKVIVTNNTLNDIINVVKDLNREVNGTTGFLLKNYGIGLLVETTTPNFPRITGLAGDLWFYILVGIIIIVAGSIVVIYIITKLGEEKGSPGP